jgi:cytochrome P450
MTHVPYGQFLASNEIPFFDIMDRYGQRPIYENMARDIVLAAVDLAEQNNRADDVTQFVNCLLMRVQSDEISIDEASHHLLLATFTAKVAGESSVL